MGIKTICAIILGVLGMLLPWVLPMEGLSEAGRINLGIFLLAAAFWILEPVPIYATSVLVILLQVLLLSAQGPVALWLPPEAMGGFDFPSYTVYFHTLASPIIILFLGGFTLAAAAVKYGLDRNLCRIILKPFGNRPGSIVLGLMIVTALLSGFMSNTATAAMMMAVILPILASSPEGDRFRTGLVLCIPFAANIGGILTPIGTPPNAIAIHALNARGVEMPFTTWMMLTAPVVCVLLLLVWGLLLKLYPSSQKQLVLKLEGTFDLSAKAWVLYGVFALTVVLWVSESLHGLPSALVAFLPVALLPCFGVIGQKDIRNLPWEVLWLMAGGIALGVAMRATGLAEWMVDQVPWGMFGAWGVLAAFGIVAILMSTFISNTVAATLLIPIVMTLVASGVAEGFSMVVAALMVAVGASMAMALPISTPPNAIAMSTGLIRPADMARAGMWVSVIGYGLLLLAAWAFWNMFF